MIKAEDIKLGQTVYYCNCKCLELYCYVVHAIGKDFFIPADYQWLLDEYQEVKLNSRHLFARLKDAKAHMSDYYKKLCKKDKEYRNMTLKKCHDVGGDVFYRYIDKEVKHGKKKDTKD